MEVVEINVWCRISPDLGSESDIDSNLSELSFNYVCKLVGTLSQKVKSNFLALEFH